MWVAKWIWYKLDSSMVIKNLKGQDLRQLNQVVRGILLELLNKILN